MTDLDGDGKSEIVAATDLEELSVFAADGERLWSKTLAGWITRVLPADLDGDGPKELIVSTFAHHLYVFEADGTQRWEWSRESGSTEFGSVGLWKRNAEGTAQVLGPAYISFVTLDPAGTPVTPMPDVGGVRMDALLTEGVDLTGDGIDDQVAHGYYTSNVFVLDGQALLQCKSIGVPTGPALGLELISRDKGVARVLCVTSGGVSLTRITEPDIEQAEAVADASGLGRKESISKASPQTEHDWSYAIGPINAYAIVEQGNGAPPLIAVGKRDGTLMVLNVRGNVRRRSAMPGDIRGLAAIGQGPAAKLAVATDQGIHVLDAQLKPQAGYTLPGCGAVAWLVDDGPPAVIGMTDGGAVAAFPLPEPQRCATAVPIARPSQPPTAAAPATAPDWPRRCSGSPPT